MTLYPLLKKKMPKGAAFYKLSMYVYLAVAGGAVHLPCGVFMWLYHSVTDAAGQEIGYHIALQYVLYFTADHCLRRGILRLLYHRGPGAAETGKLK